jgi:hypothetical protein
MQGLRSIFRRALIFILFPMILFTAAQAQATIVQYDNRTAFEAIGPYIIESWDEFGNGTIIDNRSTVHGITYNYVPDIPAFARTDVNFMVTQAYADTTGSNTLGLTSDDGGYPYFTYDGVEFVFSQRVRAFGIDISTYATDDHTFMAITNNGDVAYSVFNPFPGLTTGQFLGFTSDEPFTSVTLTYNSALIGPNFTPYSWVLDTMRVPLPPSLLLLGSGLAGLGLLRFKKRFKA